MRRFAPYANPVQAKPLRQLPPSFFHQSSQSELGSLHWSLHPTTFSAPRGSESGGEHRISRSRSHGRVRSTQWRLVMVLWKLEPSPQVHRLNPRSFRWRYHITHPRLSSSPDPEPELAYGSPTPVYRHPWLLSAP